MRYEWKTVSLGDLLNFRRGHDLPQTTMKNGDIPVVASNGVIGYHDIATTPCPCLTIGRSGNVGKPHYLEQKAWAHNTTLYVDDFKDNNPLFLYYLLQTLSLEHYRGGSAVPTLNRNHIHPIQVKVPKQLSTQKAIAETLSCLDDKIKLNNRINKNLEEQAQAIFKSWFVDFEPFQNGEFIDSELGKIPKGWRVGKPSEIVTFNTDTYKAIDNWQFVNYLDTGNITKNVIDKIQHIDLSNEKLPSRARRKISSRDLVFSSVRPNQHHYGIIIQSQENMLASTGFIVIRGEGTYFLYYYLTQDSIIDFLQAVAEQTVSTYPSIKAYHIESLDIVLPPVSVIRKFTNIIDNLHQLIEQNQQQNQALATLRDTLLPKLMSGEIQIPQEV